MMILKAPSRRMYLRDTKCSRGTGASRRRGLPLRLALPLQKLPLAKSGFKVRRYRRDILTAGRHGTPHLVPISVHWSTRQYQDQTRAKLEILTRSLQEHGPPCKHPALTPTHSIPQVIQQNLLSSFRPCDLGHGDFSLVSIQHRNGNKCPSSDSLTVVFGSPFWIIVFEESIASGLAGW